MARDGHGQEIIKTGDDTRRTGELVAVMVFRIVISSTTSEVLSAA